MTWKKDKWDKDGRWSHFGKGKNSEISIGHEFSGVIHIFYNQDRLKAASGSRTIKVVKSKSEALRFVKKWMKQHPRG